MFRKIGSQWFLLLLHVRNIENGSAFIMSSIQEQNSNSKLISESLNKFSFEENVKRQVSYDLLNYISDFYSKSAALSKLEERTKISRRQIHRYLIQSSMPHFQNMKTLYGEFYKETHYAGLNKLVPSIIKEYFQLKNPIKTDGETKYNLDFSKEMISCPVFLSIYWQTVDGGLLEKKNIVKKFGEYGISVLSSMLKQNIVKETFKDTFTGGLQRSAPINMDAASQVSAFFVKNFFKPDLCAEHGKNYMGLNVIKLDKDSKEEILKKMERLNSEIIEISNRPKYGEQELFFSTLCIDTMKDLGHSLTGKLQ